MYKLEFLPIAKKDIADIMYYISNNLKNDAASIKISNCFINSANSILTFPCGFAEYKPKQKLE